MSDLRTRKKLTYYRKINEYKRVCFLLVEHQRGSRTIEISKFSVRSWSRTLAFFGSSPRRVFEVLGSKFGGQNLKN
jgi:hypothetical protein